MVLEADRGSAGAGLANDLSIIVSSAFNVLPSRRDSSLLWKGALQKISARKKPGPWYEICVGGVIKKMTQLWRASGETHAL